MLNNVYDKLNEDKSNYDKLVIPKPELNTQNRKTIWKNVKDFLIVIKRPPEHFLYFLNNELDNIAEWLTESKSKGILLKKKINIKDISRLIKRYIEKYVICKSCKITDTIIRKDKNYRLYILICNNCGTNYSV